MFGRRLMFPDTELFLGTIRYVCYRHKIIFYLPHCFPKLALGLLKLGRYLRCASLASLVSDRRVMLRASCPPTEYEENVSSERGTLPRSTSFGHGC